MGCKIIESIGYVKSQVYKMDVATDLAYICMIARLPMLMVGNPGTGKSHTSKIIAKMFGQRDMDWFYQSITAKTSPEKLFGGLVAEQMLAGVEEYNLSVGAATKIGNIFDELYKSQHPAMMNALLNYFDEEPSIFSGGKNVSPMWHWAFNTSNFEDLPEDLRYCPLWDRQGAKFLVRNLENEDSKEALKLVMGQRQKPATSPQLTVADLELARKAALNFTVAQETITVFYDKALPILQKHCYISQRKINSLFVGKPGNPSILQATAYINYTDGEQVITPDLLSVMPYFCWQDTKTYDVLIAEVQRAIIPACVQVYLNIKTNLTKFNLDVKEGKYSSYEAAKQAQRTLSESVRIQVEAINIQERNRVPQKLRQECNSLTAANKAAVEALAHKALDNMAF